VTGTPDAAMLVWRPRSSTNPGNWERGPPVVLECLAVVAPDPAAVPVVAAGRVGVGALW
jgi:hypothetical protein